MDQEAFKTVRKFFNIFYVLPSKNDNIIKFMILTCFIKFLGTCLVVGGFLHLMKVIREHIEEIDASEDVVVISAGFGTVMIVVVYTYLQKDWDIFLKNILNFTVYPRPRNLDRRIKSLNFWGVFFAYYYIGGCIVYSVVSYMDGPYCNKINKEKDLHLICNTFVPIWLPFDVPNIYIRYGIFIAQFIIILLTVCPSAIMCFLTYQCAEILTLQIDELKNHFQFLVSPKHIKNRLDGIGYWVRYHIHILSLAQDLRNLVKKTIGNLTLISALVFGCAENQVMKGVKPLGALLFFVGWLVALFLICHAGERLMNSFFSIHDAVRDSNWYLVERDIQKDIVFILLRCQKPVYLDALPLGAMNYALFILIVRTSYSYLTLLNQSV